DIHGWAGRRDEKALPFRFREELARITGDRVARILAGHLDVAAERQRADSIVCVAAAETNQPGPETYRERFNFDFEELGDSEMAEFMNNDDDAKDDKGNEDVGRDGSNHEYCYILAERPLL